VGALDFSHEEFTREDSRLSSPVPVDVGAKIKIIPLENGKGPVFDTSLFMEPGFEPIFQTPEPKISADREWPLLVFTLLITSLVGVYSAGLTDGFSLSQKVVFMAVAVLAAFFSTLHLGKKSRAWRAILNVRNSWLSREIMFFSLFVVAVGIDFFFFDLPNYLVILLGAGLLLSIDMLYQAATWRWTLKLHSAQTLLIGLSLFLLLSEMPGPFAAIGFVRILLYLYKQWGKRTMLSLSGLSRVVLLVITILLSFFMEGWIPVFIFALGEILDRITFYNELTVSHPQIEINRTS
jgi:hypothetical protein